MYTNKYQPLEVKVHTLEHSKTIRLFKTSFDNSVVEITCARLLPDSDTMGRAETRFSANTFRAAITAKSGVP